MRLLQRPLFRDIITKRGDTMVIYAIILFLTSAVFAVVARQIYQGRTDLIHEYHQEKVTDKAGYGKAFGKAMAVIAAAMALSAAVSLLGERAAWAAVTVLTVGLIVGIIAIVRVQKKYNGGMF